MMAQPMPSSVSTPAAIPRRTRSQPWRANIMKPTGSAVPGTGSEMPARSKKLPITRVSEHQHFGAEIELVVGEHRRDRRRDDRHLRLYGRSPLARWHK
jgi:hypothetical protein